MFNVSASNIQKLLILLHLYTLQIVALIQHSVDKKCLLQPFGPSNLKSLSNVQNKENQWENSKKENNRKNIVNPIIPVAQFEAFKVYEDAAYESKLEKFEERVRARSTSNVYKGSCKYFGQNVSVFKFF